MLSECIYKVLMASGVVTSSDACDLSGAIEAAVLEAQAKQKPAYTFHLDSTGAAYLRGECVSKEGAPLYAAPVVQPDMVMVPREATEAMLDAAMNRYQHVSPEARLHFFQMHRENLRCDYKAMIAAAEGKSNANVCGLPHGKDSK
jgi:hypothetical protein